MWAGGSRGPIISQPRHYSARSLVLHLNPRKSHPIFADRVQESVPPVVPKRSHEFPLVLATKGGAPKLVHNKGVVSLRSGNGTRSCKSYSPPTFTNMVATPGSPTGPSQPSRWGVSWCWCRPSRALMITLLVCIQPVGGPFCRYP